MTTAMIVVAVAAVGVLMVTVLKELISGMHEDWLCSEMRMKIKLGIAMRALDYGDIDRRTQRDRNYVQAGMDMKAYRKNHR